MTSIEEDGPHTHSPCSRCGVAEAVLCEECRPEIDADALRMGLERSPTFRQIRQGRTISPAVDAEAVARELAQIIAARLTSPENVP